MDAVIEPGRRHIQDLDKLGDSQETGDLARVGLATLLKNMMSEANGFDGTGNHKSKNNLFNSDVKNINLDNFPNKIVESSIHRLITVQ